MSTKLKRYTVIFPPDLQKMVEKDADINQRSISNQVVWNLTNYYAEQKRAASLFTPQQLGEERREAPFFEMPAKLEDQPQEKRRDSRGQGKS